jgi:hypothetical protein
MRIPRANQQKMLKDLLKFLLSDPISIVFLPNLQNVFILPRCLDLRNFENLAFPFAFRRCVGFDHMALSQTILEFIKNSLFSTFQFDHSDSTYKLYHSLELEFLVDESYGLVYNLSEYNPEVIFFIFQKELPNSITVEPHSDLPFCVLKGLEYSFDYPGIN